MAITPRWLRATGTTLNKWLLGTTGSGVAATIDASGLTSARTLTLPDESGTAALASQVPQGLNVLANSSFLSWPRGTSAISVANQAYGPADWFGLTDGTVTMSQVSLSLGAAGPVTPGARVTNAGAGSAGLMIAHIVESNGPGGLCAQSLRGQRVTLSVWIGGTGGLTGKVALYGWSGTADSTSCRTTLVSSWSGGHVPTFGTSSWTQYGSTATASLSTTQQRLTTSVTLGTNVSNLVVVVWAENTSSTNFIQMAGVSLTPGDLAPALWQPHPDDEYLSDRYARALVPTVAANGNGYAQYDGIFNSDGSIGFQVPHHLRIGNPSLTTSSPSWASSSPSAANSVAAWNYRTGSYLAILGTPTFSVSDGGQSDRVIITPNQVGPTVINATEGSNAGSSGAITLPTYSALNLLGLIVFSNFSSVPTPSGWTPTASSTALSGSSAFVYLFTKSAAASETAPTLQGDVSWVCFSSANAAFDVAGTIGSNNANGQTSFTASGLTPAGSNDVLFSVFCGVPSAFSPYPVIPSPGGETGITQANFHDGAAAASGSLKVSYETLSSSSATGTRSSGSVTGGTYGQTYYFLFALKSATAGFTGANAGDTVGVRLGSGAMACLSAEI